MALLGKWTARTEHDSEGNGALARLVATVQTERQSLEAVLASANELSADIPDLRLALDDSDRRVSDINGRLDALQARIDAAGGATRRVESLEGRLASIESTIERAEARAAQSLERAAEIDSQRASLQELVSMAAGLVVKIETLNRDAADIKRLEEQLPALRDEYHRVVSQQAALAGDVDRLRSLAAALVDDTAATRQASQQAQESAARAAETIAGVQEQIDLVRQLETASHETTAQLQALNALAEHVNSKARALEQQHQTIERALVESRKVTEMVWNMDVQIGRLNKGATLTARVEEDLTRLERLHQDSAAQLDEATRASQTFAASFEQQRREAAELLQNLERRVDYLDANRKEVDTLRERVDGAQAALGDVERRVEAVSSAQAAVTSLSDAVRDLSARLGDVATRTEAIEHKQSALDTLEARLAEADDLARRTGLQIEALHERRDELQQLEIAFAQFDTIHAEARRLTEALAADKRELARFMEQAGEFLRESPQLLEAIDALRAGVEATEARAGHATAMKPAIDELAGQIERLTPRLAVVEDLQTRLNDLHALSADLDRRLSVQLGRQAEIEGIRIACDGLSTRVTDLHHTMAGLDDAQAKLAPIPDRISALDETVHDIGRRLDAIRRDDEVLASQEQRLEALSASADALSRDLAARLETLRALQVELGQAGTWKDQLRGDLTDMQRLQREIVAAIRGAEEQQQQLAVRCQQIEQQRAHVAVAERMVEAFEHRMLEAERSCESLNARIAAVSTREKIVEAVRREVEAVHGVARKVQDDLAAIEQAHTSIADGKAEVQRLLDALGVATASIADVEARSRGVDDVRRRADAVLHLLDDMRVTLDAVCEQKATLDHVTDDLARLHDMIAEARGTAKVLQDERRLAQRIVDTIRGVHARVEAHTAGQSSLF